ncbi:hypothetical protein KR96_18870 [Ralstonia solanacearum]|nr:hypothetical protein KR96_18870 [Ralstonia solanacearum]KFX81240.1 hypothetical protein KR99_24635 [Ralstonia solanacearum]
MGVSQGEKNAKAELAAQTSQIQNDFANAKRDYEACGKNIKFWQDAHAKLLSDNAALAQRLAANDTNVYLQTQINEAQADINFRRTRGFGADDAMVQMLEGRLRTLVEKLQCRT